MTQAEKKQLILSLIKDNLIHNKLIKGLNAAGLECNLYFLRLGETIFKLIGFSKDNDEIYEAYMKLFDRADHLDIMEDEKALHKLALEIYSELLNRKLEQE
jgi:hypothetical protein